MSSVEGFPAPVRGPLWLGLGLTVLVVAATLGEGGARPGVELAGRGLIIALVIGGILSRPSRGPRLDAPTPLVAFALFFVMTLVGATVAPYAYAAWETVETLTLFVAVVWLAGRSGPELLTMLTPVLLGAAAVQGALAIFQRFAEGQTRPPGTFLNPNHLAAWLVAVVLLALGSAPVANRTARTARIALAAAAATGLALTGSRGAIVAIAAGGGGLLWMRWRSRRERVIVAAVLAVLGIVLVVAVLARSSSFDPFRYHRVRIWRASLTAVLDHPWSGTGPGQFPAAAANLNFPLEDDVLRYERHFVSPHSDLVRLPAEFGFPAAVAALAAVALTARELLQRRRRDSSIDGAIAALLALAAQATVDDLSDRPAIWLLGAVLAGASLSRASPPPVRSNPVLRAGVAVLVVLGFMAADARDYRAWRLRSTAPKDAEPAARIDEAIRLNPLRAETRLQLANELVRRNPWDALLYARAREVAETGVRLQPADARYRVALAQVEVRGFFELFGDADSRARFDRHYREAEALARHNPLIAIEHGGLLLAAADLSGARRAAERALAIEPNAVLPRVLLAEILVASGDFERAAEVLDEAESLARRYADLPKETSYARELLTLDEDRAARIRDAIDHGIAIPFHHPEGDPS